MKRVIAAALLALTVSACSASTIQLERHEGRDCMVVRNLVDKPRAIDCDWGDR